MKKKYKKIRKYAGLYIMLAIPFLWYIIFKYIPMYGLQIAFKRFNPTLGFREPLAGVKRQKVFCNITREQPTEMRKVSRDVIFTLQKKLFGKTVMRDCS